MSKSIYEEALEELKDLEVILYYDVSKIKKALIIAKKEHELLDLYKYLNENTNDYDLHYDKVDEIDNKIDKIEERIKELENDNT